MNPADVNWKTVIDISEHQGEMEFEVTRAAGVQGLIMRVSHGMTLDARINRYYPQSLDAGFDPVDVGFYPFINPKRGTARATAMFALEAIDQIRGDLDCFYMLDVESYINESPNKGSAPFSGARFADYIREHIATVREQAPLTRVLGYGNRAFWNGPISRGSAIQWVGDAQLASELEWIVARYPVSSMLGYLLRPVPATPEQWDEYAFARAPEGPFPPLGADGWQGWQFSAGYNKQGSRYGASSTHLDLNIVHPDAWLRWTAQLPQPPPPPPPPPIGDDMPHVLFDLQDVHTTLWGQADKPGGLVMVVHWSGPGGTAWSAVRDLMVQFGAEERKASAGNFTHARLDGDLPPTMEAEHFFNSEEIKARSAPVAAVDEVAQAGVQFCRDELLGMAARDDQLRADQIATWSR